MARLRSFLFALAALAAATTAPPVQAQDARAQSGHEHPILQQVRQIQEEVERLRGLEFRAQVKVGIQKPEALRAMLLEDFEEEAPAEEMAKQERVLKRLGLIPADFDLRQRLLQFLSDQIGGFYDPEKKELFLIDRSEEGAMGGAAAQAMNDQMVMAHELHHALQDQHFALERWFDLLGDHEDRIQGYKSLVEGEAQLVGMTYLFGKMGRGDVDLKALNRMNDMMMKMTPEGAKLAALPPYLLENMMFPYTQGAEFIQDMQRKKGWDAIARAFGDPPTSTEQVLHPEKYYDRDEPTELLIPTGGFGRILGEESEVLYENTLGEFSTSLLLRAIGLSKRDAARAAAGWDGDRFAGLEAPDGRVVVVWLTTWDSEAEAQEFERAYAPALQRFSPGARLERRGTEVLLVDGAQGEELAQLVRKGFMAVKVEQRLQPLAGMVEQPTASELTPGAAGERQVMAGQAGEAALVHLDAQSATLLIPSGFEPRAESIEALATLGGAHFTTGERGVHLRAFELPLPLEAARDQISELVEKNVRLSQPKPGEDSVVLQEQFSATAARVRGLRSVEVAFTGKLPGDSVSSRTYLALVDRGVPGQTLAVGVSHPDPARAKELFEQLTETLWVDAPNAPKAAQAQWESGTTVATAFVAHEGFAPQVAPAGPEGVTIHAYAASSDQGQAKIQVVAAPALGDLASYGARIQAQLQLVDPEVRIVSAGVVSRGGQEAFELEYELAGRRARQVSYQVGDRLWTLSCSAPGDLFESFGQPFSRSIASFTVAARQGSSGGPQRPAEEEQPRRRAY